MNKALKWVLIAGGGLVALIIVALLIIPMFLDVQKYKPEIEKRVSEATGRPFAIGGQLSLSLFPWAGVSLSDLRLGNPPGFKEEDLLRVKAFEVRLKLLPLLFKDIQVKRFILQGPRLVLVKGPGGQTNWEGLGKGAAQGPSRQEKAKEERPPQEAKGGLPIKGLAVGEFAVTKGSLLWIDHGKGERKEIADLNLRLEDVSLDRPIGVDLSAMMDGHPLALKGAVGPIGKEPGKGSMPLELSVKVFEELEMALKGKVVDAVTKQEFDLALEVSPFSPRRLTSALGQEFPVKTADPKALERVALKATLRGNPRSVSVSDATLQLDESTLAFSMRAKDLQKPDVAFDLNLDKIDLDRYLASPSEQGPAKEKGEVKGPVPKRKKTDYRPLRKLVLDGQVRVGELKVRGIKARDIRVKVSGKNGLFNLDPLSARLYEGEIASRGTLDVRKDLPRTEMALQASGIQVSPLLKDLLKKDFLAGTMKAKMDIAMAGDDPEIIKKTLDGSGDFLFKDGAIVGIDLAGMVRNVKATFGLAEKGAERPRTDFSELHSPFTIRKGVVDTRNTRLSSPLLRVLAAGKANLLQDSLDFRVEPKFVATLKGQGDVKERAGLTVPVLVTGTFSSPRFRPDLKGLLKQRLKGGIPEPSQLKKMLPVPGQGGQGESQPVEEKAKDLLKKLPFGR